MKYIARHQSHVYAINVNNQCVHIHSEEQAAVSLQSFRSTAHHCVEVTAMTVQIYSYSNDCRLNRACLSSRYGCELIACYIGLMTSVQ